MQATYWVIPNLLAGRCGPRQVPWDLAAFRRAGVRLIVSLADVGLTPVETGREGMVLHECWLPMSALATAQERLGVLRRVTPVLRAIEESLGRQEGVLTHCAMGIDRTGLVLACALMMVESVTAEAAIARVHQANSQALQLEGYQRAVVDFGALWDRAERCIRTPGSAKGLTAWIRPEAGEAGG
ncbi:MAG: dual specificity protein phosphatase family protein [Planctomycetota bacterium]